jgi:hypothetical protein
MTVVRAGIVTRIAPNEVPQRSAPMSPVDMFGKPSNGRFAPNHLPHATFSDRPPLQGGSTITFVLTGVRA